MAVKRIMPAEAKELLGQGRGSVLEGHSMQTYLDRLTNLVKRS